MLNFVRISFFKTCPVVFLWALLFLVTYPPIASAHDGLSYQNGLANETIENQWFSREYDKFIINYPKYAEDSVDTYAKWYQYFFPKYQKFFAWTPKEKFQVSLFSHSDIFNGYSTPLPYNQNGLYLTNYDELGALTDRSNLIRLVVNHELVHLFHIDKNSGVSENLRNALGRNILTFPAIFQPKLFIEGLATYFETNKEKGFGRGANSWFPARMRMEVRKGIPAKINSLLNSYHNVPHSAAYLYGYYFIAYLVDKYGENSLQRWINGYSDNIIPARVGSNAQHLGGLSLENEWSAFISWLQATFSPQISKLKQQKKSAPAIISIENANTEKHNQPFFLDAHSYVYFENNGRVAPRLIHYDLISKTKKVWFSFNDSLGGIIRYDFHPKFGLLFTQLSQCRGNTGDKILFDLYHVENGSKDIKRLTHCQSIRRAIWDKQGDILAIQPHRPNNQLTSAKKPALATSNKLIYSAWQTNKLSLSHEGLIFSTLLSIPFDSTVESLDVAEDTLALSIKKSPQGFNIYQTTLSYDDGAAPSIAQLEAIIENKNNNVRVRFDAQHRLHYIGDEGDVYNLYRYDGTRQESQKLTDVIGGIVDYDVNHSSYISVSKFAPEGFDYGYIKNPDIITKITNQSSVEEIDITNEKELITLPLSRYEDKEYSAMNTLMPTGWLPIFQSGNNGLILGAQTNGGDPLNMHSYQLSAGLYNYKNYSNALLNLLYGYKQTWQFFLSQIPELRIDKEDNETKEYIRVTQSLALNYIYPISSKIQQSLGINYQKKSYETPSSSDISLFQDNQQGYVGAVFQYKNAPVWRKQMQPHQGINMRIGIDTLAMKTAHLSPSQMLSFNTRYYHPIALSSIFSSIDIAQDLQQTASLQLSDNFSIPNAIGNRSYQHRGSKDIATINADSLQKIHLGWQSRAKIIDYGLYDFPIGLGKISMQMKTGIAHLANSKKQQTQSLYNYEINLLADAHLLYGNALPLILSFAQSWTDKGEDDKEQTGSSFSLSINLPY